jgi:hypothetical protein
LGTGVPPPSGNAGISSAAVQFPGVAQESAVTRAMNELTWSVTVKIPAALPKAPPVLASTNACRLPLESTYHPPIVHWPAAGHDSAVISVGPPPPSCARPGTGAAFPHEKPVSLATNAWWWP